MTDVSGQLRAAREQAGLTIEEVSARTKIKAAQLQALERGEFEQLPGEFFVRAFIRTYARELRLPVEPLIAAYEAQRAASADTATAAEGVRPRDTAPPGAGTPGAFGAPTPRSAWPLAALIMVVLAVVFLIDRAVPDRAASVTDGAVGTAGSADASAPSDEASTSQTDEPDTLRMEIRPTRPTWVTAYADGHRVLFRTLEPGERITLEASDQLRFRVGDAGAFEYTLNGARGVPPGRPGEVREFTISRETYQSLVR